MRRVRPEIWALLAVQLLFASNAVVGRLNVEYLGPRFLILVRVVGATLCFAALARSAGAVLPSGRREFAWLALCGALGVALNQGLYLTGLSLSTATHASIIGTSVPVFTAAFAALAGDERLSWGRLAGIGLALAGALTLARLDTFRLSTRSLGDLLFIANSLSYAGYLVVSRRLVRRYGAPTVVLWSFAFGSLLLLPYDLPGLAILHSGAQLPRWLFATVAYTILFPTVLAYFLNAYALRQVDASTAAAFIYLQPLFAVTLAIPVLGEHPSPRTGAAALLVFLGVALSTRAERGARLPPPVTP
ncbi:MAG: DMT family transporter [Deltaproteobacteria bacterium]